MTGPENQNLPSEKPKDKANKSKETERAFINMLTTTSRNHYSLNQMVDRKARILLSINALILSLIIGKIIVNHNIHDFKFMILVIFGIVCIVSMLYSMFAVLPEKRHGNGQDENSIDSFNLLFFGNFKALGAEEYEGKLLTLKEDPEKIQKALIKDIYHLGTVLESKRSYLRTSLYLLISGITIALFLSFIFRLLYGDMPPDPIIPN